MEDDYLQECSHIINIFQKEADPPKNRGNLYLSSVYLLEYSEVFKINNIDCLFSIIDDFTYKTYKIPSKMKQLNITQHKWVDLLDSYGTGVYDHLHDAHAYLKQMLQQHNVLVHCQQGKCRSPSLVVGFLIKQFGMTYDQAHAHTKSQRDIIQINHWFEQDLRKFEREIKESHSLQKND